MRAKVPVIFVLGKLHHSSPIRAPDFKYSNLLEIGCPGAGKTTLCTKITRQYAVRHISVGNLLRQIKNDATHALAETITSKLNKQELIDGHILVSILKSDLSQEEPEHGRRTVLLDGYPRNMEQLRAFEDEVEHSHPHTCATRAVYSFILC